VVAADTLCAITDFTYTFLLLAQVIKSEVEPAEMLTTLSVSLPFSNAMTFFFSYLV
jgi:hypothetical protein